jgi:hydrogenase nickel incorporation protein HypA/HybF
MRLVSDETQEIMHEFAITEAILSIVLQKAQEVNSARITQIDLQVGKLTGFIPESIQLQFALLSKGTAAEGANLTFHQVPARLHCRRCNADFTTDSCEISCPNCRTLEIDVISGMELSVESMEIE